MKRQPILRVKKNKQGYYYITLQAANGKILFHTEAFESPRSKRIAKDTIETIKRNLDNARVEIEE